MKVRANIEYRDLQLGRIVKKDEMIEVDEARGIELIKKKFNKTTFASLVEEEASEEEKLDEETLEEEKLDEETLSKMKKDELMKIASEKGIEPKGKKDEIIKQILNSVNNE